jgi:hypothetical protein
MVKKTKGLLLAWIVVLLFPSMASGQAVFLARKAVGVISRIADQARGHETASVLLEADANKVFSAAVKIINEKPSVQLVSQDVVSRTISFRHDGQAITLKVSRLQDDLAQILVLASGWDGQPDTSYVINGILRICKEMGVHCSVCID